MQVPRTKGKEHLASTSDPVSAPVAQNPGTIAIFVLALHEHTVGEKQSRRAKALRIALKVAQERSFSCGALCPLLSPLLLCRRSMSAPLVMDEAELPEVLREALKAARERMADKRARRARGEAGNDEDDDDDEEFEVRLDIQQSALLPCRPLCSL